MKFPPDGHPYFKPPYQQPDKDRVWALWVVIGLALIVAGMIQSRAEIAATELRSPCHPICGD